MSQQQHSEGPFKAMSYETTNYGSPSDREKGMTSKTVYETHEDRTGPVFNGDINEAAPLKRNLHGRHMQMIAIGGSIGAGLFVGLGSALYAGGPASVLIGFLIIGLMILMVMQALGELTVLYPTNGAFTMYFIRFIDPSVGFALGWIYAISWLTVLPFELTAAGITISFWRPDLNVGIWIATFFVALCLIQFLGVRGYGEVEYVLGMIKVIACVGFIILGIIIDAGGVPTDPRHGIGFKYWRDPGAFANGFQGFCAVFVTASFAFGGTELAGLAAAEASNPAKQMPAVTKQVFWRILIFYVLNVFVVGLIVPSNDENLTNASGANTRYSPFVIAIQLAGIKVLPHIFNAVITIAVLSVANSATFGSTRTFQALATQGMAPKVLSYVDKKGRPLATIALQLAFALLAFINEAKVGDAVFNWLLALSGIQNFFTWGSICLAHIKFRRGWVRQGHSIDELPFKAMFGVVGSYIGLALNVICLIAQFYVALWPIGGKPDIVSFLQAYLTAPMILLLYVIWKLYSVFSKDPRINHRGWRLFYRSHEMDIRTGLRTDLLLDPEEAARQRLMQNNTTFGQRVAGAPKAVWSALIH